MDRNVIQGNIYKIYSISIFWEFLGFEKIRRVESGGGFKILGSYLEECYFFILVS